MIYCALLAAMGLLAVSEGGPTTPILPALSKKTRSEELSLGAQWVSLDPRHSETVLVGESEQVRQRSRELARQAPWSEMGAVHATWAGPVLVAQALAPSRRESPLRLRQPGLEGVLSFLDENARWFGIRGRADLRPRPPPDPFDPSRRTTPQYVRDVRGPLKQLSMIDEMTAPPMNVYLSRPSGRPVHSHYVFEQVFEDDIQCEYCTIELDLDDDLHIQQVVNNLVIPFADARYTLAEAKEAFARQHAFPFDDPDPFRDLIRLRVDRDKSGLPRLRWVIPYTSFHRCVAKAIVDAWTLKWIGDEHDEMLYCVGAVPVCP